MANTWIIDLTHYLDEHGAIVKVPHPLGVSPSTSERSFVPSPGTQSGPEQGRASAAEDALAASGAPVKFEPLSLSMTAWT